MKDALERLDDALIDRVFQPLADWLDQHVALDIFRVARTLVDLASLMWICAEAAERFDGSGLAFAHFTVIVLGLWALSTLRKVFERPAGTRAQANPLRAGMNVHRAACLFWLLALLAKTAEAPADLAPLALLAVGVFATSALYIGACTKPPPKWRESRTFAWSASKAL
jgi:hypothetical protein